MNFTLSLSSDSVSSLRSDSVSSLSSDSELTLSTLSGDGELASTSQNSDNELHCHHTFVTGFQHLRDDNAVYVHSRPMPTSGLCCSEITGS